MNLPPLCGFGVIHRAFGLAEMPIPFGIPFGHVFELFKNAHCLGCWSFGRRGNHNPSTKARAAIGVGQGIVVQSQADYFVVQQLDLYRVGHADLEGQRFVSCFFGSIKRCASSPKAPSH